MLIDQVHTATKCMHPLRQAIAARENKDATWPARSSVLRHMLEPQWERRLLVRAARALNYDH